MNYYVSTTGSDSNIGSEALPFLTIPYAITQASNGDTIYIMNGTYNYGDTNSNNVININKQISIIGRQTTIETRPKINIITASQNTAVLCNTSNITLQGLEIVHNPATVGSNDTCITLAPGGTPIFPDSGIMVNENINIIDCKIAFTKFGVLSKAKYFSVKNCELVSKAVTTARNIAIYSQDGTIDILDNVFGTSVNNNGIELLNNNFATNDSYQNKRNGIVNFIGNSTTGININRRAIFFDAGADTGLSEDKYSFNVSNNNISSTSDCMILLQPTNANFLNFINLIKVNNNTFNNNPTASNNGLIRIASFVSNGGPLTTPINTPKFSVYSNTINNTTLVLSSNPYNVDSKDLLILTGFSANSDGQRTGGLSTSTINTILSTVDVPKQNQTITFNALPSQIYSLNGVINLSGTASSGLPVSYSSSDINVVEVSGSTLIIKGVGSSIISASQPGDTNYNPAADVNQTQVIDKANQTITFNDSSFTFTDLKYILNATSSSGLPITYTSSDNEIALIFNGNQLVFNKDGKVNVTASQLGNYIYNPATSVVKEFVKNSIGSTNYTGGQIYISGFANNIITNLSGSLNITIQSNNFTQTSGIAYLINSGFHGGVLIVNITALNGSGNPITDFSAENLLINLILPQANPSSTLKMYKLDTSNNTIIQPQPTGYPVTLQYQLGYWTALLPSLSTYLIQDTNPSGGGGGGDPHIKTVYGKQILLPNDWLYVKLYQKDDIKVNAKCAFIDNDLIKNLHNLRNRNNDSTIYNLNPTIDTYASNLTYFVEIYIFKNDELVFKHDLLNDKELINKNIILEKNKFSKGLYSLTHKSFWPVKNLSSFFVHLNKNNILCIDIDNFWDDINYISIKFFDTNYEGYSGEFFNHSIENKIL